MPKLDALRKYAEENRNTTAAEEPDININDVDDWEQWEQLGELESQRLIEKIESGEVETPEDLREQLKQFYIFLRDIQTIILKQFEEGNLFVYIKEELKKPEYQGKTMSDLFRETDGDSNLTLWGKAVQNAEAAMKRHQLEGDKEGVEWLQAFEQFKGTGVPERFISQNSLIINKLNECIEEGKKNLHPVENVKVCVAATLENMENIEITGKPFSGYDRAVCDTISSIFEHCRKHEIAPGMITPDMIYRTMTHKTQGEYVSQTQRKKVAKSIEKMRKHIYLRVDLTEEMKKRGIVTNEKGRTENERHKFILDDFFLTGTHFDNKAIGGNNVSGWIFKEPLMLKYARLTGQVITVNSEMLDIQKVSKRGNITGEAIPNTEKRIAMKHYLLRRVEIIRKDEERARENLRKYNGRRRKHPTMPKKTIDDFREKSKIKRSILFKSIFEDAEIASAGTRDREYVYQVLDYWKAKGKIKGYKTRKKGKAFNAVIIDI